MDLLRLLNQSHPSALFCGSGWPSWPAILFLHDPVRVLTANQPAQLGPLLEAAQEEQARGHHLAGYLTFEAGAAFDLPGAPPAAGPPLAWLAAFPPEHALTLRPADFAALPGLTDLPRVSASLNVSPEDYAAAIRSIKAYLAAGDTYQVNFTCHARFALEVHPLSYFLALVRSHPVPYAAYLQLGDRQVLSLSPELFLQRRGDLLESRPMKGTRRRGRSVAEDETVRGELLASEKDRAENLMIVDMVRNDLGRVCESGSVQVPRLFSAERYRTVWQMTSTVTGRLPEGVGLPSVLAATFPGASVTGAPKRRTLEIIRELEREPRGIYCGALGLLAPSGDFTLNLPIRTLVNHQGQWDLGIGAGIVWDSDPQAEYEETLLKASFAFRLLPDLRLFETLLLTRDRRYAFQEEHLARLAASAEYWDFPCDVGGIRRALARLAHAGHVPIVVRLELDAQGAVRFITRGIPPSPAGPVRVRVASLPTDSGDRFLYHKTTERARYDQARAEAVAHGFFEVLFHNERGQLTEGAITNLFVRVGGKWLTPPVEEGLLPGIWRAAFLAETGGEEQPVAPALLAQAEEVVIGNSVRGAIEVGGVWDETDRCLWGIA
jgi:para-aminobenzoate synthetase/4-amino-4-deoxychorismate lyase